MHCSRFLIGALLVAVLLAVAGCTTTSAPSVPAPATPAAVTPLSSLALTPSDIPVNYTVTGSREKNDTEVSRLALDLGWEAGYAVTCTNNTVTPYGQTKIVQTIARYPATSIPGIMALLPKQEQTDPDVDYTNITGPGIGDISGGYVATPHSQMVIKNADSTDPASPLTMVRTEDVAEIWFSKGTVFEVIRMSGPGSDAATVTALARSAYSKIP
jgi:hypothetical protein